MNLNNPKISGTKSLQTLIGDIDRTSAAEYTVVGTIRVPDWRGVNNHFQGIADIGRVALEEGLVTRVNRVGMDDPHYSIDDVSFRRLAAERGFD